MNKKEDAKMKQEKSCGCIVIDHHQVLLIQQVQGHIGFPKGHVEAGESEQETAIRETREETNLEVQIIGDNRYQEQYSPEEGIVKDVVYFLAQKVGGVEKRQEEEVSKIMWVDLEDAEDYITFDGSKRILRKVIADLRNRKSK